MALDKKTDAALWAQEEAEDERLIEESYSIQQRKEQYSYTEENETTHGVTAREKRPQGGSRVSICKLRIQS
jgi:phosphoserine aminotransferase